MKKVMAVFFVLATLFHAMPMKAGCGEWSECDCCEDYFLDFRYAAFFPLSSTVRKVYDNAFPDIELEVATNLTDYCRAWFNAGYIWNEGASSLGNKTTLSMVPLSLGLMFVLPATCDIDVYLGMGPSFTFLRIEDDSHYVRRHVRKNGFGGAIKTGFYYHLDENFYFEGFLDYFLQPYHFGKDRSKKHYVERHDLTMDGIKLGFGAGVTF